MSFLSIPILIQRTGEYTAISMCISPAFLCPAKCTDSIHYILSHSLIHPQRFFFHQINFCGHFSIYLRNVLPFQYLSYFFPDDLLHHWPEHIRFHDLRHTFATLSLKNGVVMFRLFQFQHTQRKVLMTSLKW